jgi:Immunity protein Imm1
MGNKKPTQTPRHVTRVHVEDRTGHKTSDVVIDCPTLTQVLDALKMLNGKNTTMVLLEMEGKNFGIAGGTAGRFTGELTYGIDDAFYTLLSSRNPAKPDDEEIELVTGQQAVLVPQRQVLDRTTVLKASRYFVAHGTMCPELIWEKHA